MIGDEALDRIINDVRGYDLDVIDRDQLRTAIDAATGHTKMVENLKAIDEWSKKFGDIHPLNIIRSMGEIAREALKEPTQ